MSNHLGNVLATVSDRRQPKFSVGGVDYYNPVVVSAQDYYPFGMEMPGRSYALGALYRFGFNGKEADRNKEFGSLVHYDYGFRIYCAPCGRFLSVDPLKRSYPMLSSYQFASNTPIWAVDLDGLEAYYTTDGTYLDNWGTNTEIRLIDNSDVAEFQNDIKAARDSPDDSNITDIMDYYWSSVGSTGLLYDVGSKITVPNRKKGITGQGFPNDHPLKFNLQTGQGGSLAGSPVKQEDLYDMTVIFDKVLAEGEANFKRSKFANTIAGRIWFGTQVTDDALYDLKSTKRKNLAKIPSFAAINIGEWTLYEGILTRYDDYGNISYGYWGTEYGLNQATLLKGADNNQDTKNGKTTVGVGDEQRDKDAILRGIHKWLNKERSN